MYIIYKAYDDNTAIVLDVITLRRQFMYERDLINFINNGHDVLGCSVSGQRINYLEAYSCLTFPSEDEADEYIRENGLSYRNKRYINGLYYVFEKTHKCIHVDYIIRNQIGYDCSYLIIGNNNKIGYSPYIQSATTFDKRTAQEKAAMMTKNSKTGKQWVTVRIPSDEDINNFIPQRF